MITDGWGRDLLPPDNAPGSQAGAQGGEDEQEEAAQEVQLPEYRGWSQGVGRPGNSDGSSIAAQRGRCLGARPKTLGSNPQPIGPFRTGESITRGQTGGAQPGTPSACKGSNPVRGRTSSGLREDAVRTQNGTTSKKATFSEPPTCSRAEILGLE